MGHHHGHSHGHHAHGAAGSSSQRALLGALLLNGSFLVVEAVVGWWTHSLALLSDAAHMASDVGALVLALVANRLAQVAVSGSRTFGLVRAEVLGAFLNGLSLAAACVWIFWEASFRLSTQLPEVAGGPVLVVGVVGLLINLGSAAALYRAADDNLNIRAAMAHMLADALGSLGAVVAALLTMAGWSAADSILSVFVAILVGMGAWTILRDSGRVLLQLPPRGADVGKMKDALLATENVVGVHDLHVWTLDGQSPIVTAHLVVQDNAEGALVCQAAHRRLRDLCGVEHVTLQLERRHAEAMPCALSLCGVHAHG